MMKALCRVSRTTIQLCKFRRQNFFSSKPYQEGNWFEKNCSHPPKQSINRVDYIDEMVRSGQAVQNGINGLINGQITNRLDENEVLKEMQENSNHALNDMNEAIKEKRSRPSLLSPIYHCIGHTLGKASNYMGNTISTSYLIGVKDAISLYYNDQIRILHEQVPVNRNMIEFIKKQRDNELNGIDKLVQEQNNQVLPQVSEVSKRLTQFLLFTSSKF